MNTARIEAPASKGSSTGVELQLEGNSQDLNRASSNLIAQILYQVVMIVYRASLPYLQASMTRCQAFTDEPIFRSYRPPSPPRASLPSAPFVFYRS
ncbi:hypothetical protein PGT21_033823, partial [Puccinia graminis f. sp. tritici]